jgi:hypothetical protein
MMKLRNFEEYGRSIAVPPMPMLKFSNGDYLVNDGAPFKNGKLVANMPTLQIGWVRYDSGFAVKQIMGKVSENFQPPGREDLGDFDKAEWETDEHGVYRDPWHATEDIVLYDPDRGNNFLLVFDNNDYEHIDFERYYGNCLYETESLGILCQVYAAHARRLPDELPVIELASRVLFTNPECGVVSIPQINVVDWWSEERSTAAERTAKLMEEVAEQARHPRNRARRLPRQRRATSNG